MRLFILFALTITFGNGAKILGIFYHPGKSHHKLGEVLFKELVKRGHEVMMVSPYPLKEPVKNYKDIFLENEIVDMNERIKNDWFKKFSKNSLTTFFMFLEMSLTQSELLYQHKEFSNLMKSGETFDLIIMDWIGNESHLVLSKVFKCPIILSSSSGLSNNVNYIVGNSEPYSYVPFKYFPLSDHMNFLERLENVLITIGTDLLNERQKLKHQEIIDHYVSPSYKIDDLLDSVALIFSNGHVSYETARPIVPNIIEVGGYHIEPPKPLPNDLQEFLDNAKEGFVYFSLGSNMKSIFLNENKRQSILKAFSKLNVKILWKFEADLPNIPKNVKISNWFPQIDVLAHPNIKIFITHGGLLSTIESIWHGVPMIGIPMFGDQKSNVRTGQQKGYSIQIKPNDISEDTLLKAINEILFNKSYSEKAKLHSDLLRNQPISPMDKAIYWVEHVIKYKGADHLKNASTKLAWYQYYLIDIALLIIFIISLTIVILTYIFKFILRIIFKRKTIADKNKKRN